MGIVRTDFIKGTIFVVKKQKMVGKHMKTIRYRSGAPYLIQNDDLSNWIDRAVEHAESEGVKVPSE